MEYERKRFIYSLVLPTIFLVLIWIIKIVEVEFGFSFVHAGVYPHHIRGLTGILSAPLIHSDWRHLIDNSGAVFLLSLALTYFYRDLAYRIWVLIYFITGILLWSIGREAWHIGASGIIYGLAGFLFLSGLIRRVRSLTAISLLVVFLYGSLVWGLLPFDYKVSFEGHISGLVAGLILAVIYRGQGPDPDRSWRDLEEDEDPGTEEHENASIRSQTRSLTVKKAGDKSL